MKDYFPFWDKLTDAQRQIFLGMQKKRFSKGTLVHNGSEDCIGLLVVLSGRLRVYTIPDEGKEITLYRLLERDICLFSASCIMKSIQFDLAVEAEEDTEVLHIPAKTYKKLMEESAAVANYTSELMADRFSEVMWLMDQVMNKKMDSRLAAFLLEESEMEGSSKLTITHEQIARHLGSVREVVTRMLKYFHQEGMVKLERGVLELTDMDKIELLAAASRR